jgi:flagellin
MSSLLTNTSAMVALQTLRSISASLDETNNRVSTGLRINSAADNAAYWSIATTTKSDNSSLSTVKDALGLGAAAVDVATQGLTAVKESLEAVKDLLVTALEPGVDRSKIQADIAARIADLASKSDSSTFNSDNWLSVDSTAANYNATKSIVASFIRSGSTITVGTIDIDISTIALYDPAGAGPAAGILDKDRTSGGTTSSVVDIDVSALTDSAADLTTVNELVQIAQAALDDVTSALTVVGAASTRVDSQMTFIQALVDANTRAVGTLVDANMEAESTKLKALQTQQQLAVQSLSIANSSTQNILLLFRS